MRAIQYPTQRWLRAIGAMLLIVSTLLAISATPAAAVGGGGPVRVTINGRCLDADTNTINRLGTKVQLWDCNGSNQQKWYANADGSIHSGYNDWCLDADTNTAGQLGTKVQLWTCNGTAQQRWSISGTRIRSGLTARCIDADLNTLGQLGTKVQLWDCNYTVQQSWSGLPSSAVTTACAAFSNEELWQTSTTAGRVRERPCIGYDAAVVWGKVELQIDFPSSCSLSIGFPPNASVSCPLSYYSKAHQLNFNSLQLSGDFWVAPTQQWNTSRCPYAASSAYIPGLTVSCLIGYAPRVPGGYTVTVHNTGGDVSNDGAGLKLLQPGHFDFRL